MAMARARVCASVMVCIATIGAADYIDLNGHNGISEGADLGNSEVSKPEKKTSWRLLNYDCTCCCKPKTLGPAKTQDECFQRLTTAGASYGYWESKVNCYSADSCDVCVSSNKAIFVFANANRVATGGKKSCTFDKQTAGVVSTLAGSSRGYQDGTGKAAQFTEIFSLAASPDGSKLYVVDTGNNKIRVVDVKTQKVSTLAGSTKGYKDGTGKAAQFSYPEGVSTSPDGSTLYVADMENQKIRVVDVKTQKVSTLAGSTKGYKDGTGQAAQFKTPFSVSTSPDGSKLYVGDMYNFKIRKVSTGCACK